MLFGGERLGPRMWLLATSLVVFGAHFSALWILMANSWMQTLEGFTTQMTQWAQYGVTDTYTDDVWPIVFPIAALSAFVTNVVMLRRGRVAAFFASSAMLAFLLATVSAGRYPNMLKSSIDPKFSMTVENASAASETLTMMLVVAISASRSCCCYTAGVRYLFRGKVELTESSY